MDYLILIYIVTFGCCGGLMAWVTIYPPKALKWQKLFWCVFVILIYLGFKATVWESQNIEEERGRAQWNLGLNIVHGFVQDRKADEMEERADRLEKLLEKSEREKQKSREFQAAKHASESKRQKEFYIPLERLIARGTNEMDAVVDYPDDFVGVFKGAANAWLAEGRKFLDATCSVSVANNFYAISDHPLRRGAPMDYLDNRVDINNFYKLRVEFLEKLRNDNAKQCDKS